MTTGSVAGHRFGQVELDLLATHTGIGWPFPLRIPVFGRIPGEREVLLSVAGETLRHRDLADDDGPLGAAAGLVGALRRYRGTVDLLLGDEAGATGIVALVHDTEALICVQRLDNDPAGLVEIRRVNQDSLLDELLALIPEQPAARTMPITLPERAVDTVADVLNADDPADDPGGDARLRRLRDLVRECGGDSAALDQLGAVLPSIAGCGQLGATRRKDKTDHRKGTELSWLDGPHGRIRVNRSGNGWVSINPLRQTDLRGALADLVVIAREPA